MPDKYIIMDKARESLRGKWKPVIITFAIYFIIQMLLQASTIGNFISLVVSGAFSYGLSKYSLCIIRNFELNTAFIFDGFNQFKLTLETFLRMFIYIIGWTLLLVVPGIIAAISYSMTFYILIDNPELTPEQAIQRSKQIMEGNKMEFFKLCLLFLVLCIICILTLGIGFFWFIPFAHVSVAQFYEEIKDR